MMAFSILLSFPWVSVGLIYNRLLHLMNIRSLCLYNGRVLGDGRDGKSNETVDRWRITNVERGNPRRR